MLSTFAAPVKTIRVANPTKQLTQELKSPLVVDGYSFRRLAISSRGDNLYGIDETKSVFIKIGLEAHERKARDNASEAQLIELLNERGAITAPQVLKKGSIDANGVLGSISLPVEGQLSYFIVSYVESSRRMRLADLVLALIEQKSLGVYQGDLKPANLRFNESSACPVLVDYDQAVELDEEIKSLGNLDFITWTFEQERMKYGEDSWLRHFSPRPRIRDIEALFQDDSFNLALTSLYARQQTTNTKQGVYHSLSTDKVYANGVRTLDERVPILDQIDFFSGEEILDVGCNIGLLAHYLAGRGCSVHGYELDPYIVQCAKIVANILGHQASFTAVDLDGFEFDRDFDTVALFSVFHHTERMVENGINISRVCQRILIECRLKESGKKPSGNTAKWRGTSAWEFQNVDELHAGLEKFFPSFRVVKNFGLVDKDRYIIELRKES